MLCRAFGLEPEVTGLPAWEKKHESMDELNCSFTARRMTFAELQIAIERATT
jgi:hypothetical protein